MQIVVRKRTSPQSAYLWSDSILRYVTARGQLQSFASSRCQYIYQYRHTRHGRVGTFTSG